MIKFLIKKQYYGTKSIPCEPITDLKDLFIFITITYIQKEGGLDND